MMPSGSVVAIVFQMPMPMAFVTMWMTALANTISVAFAMAQAPFSSVDAAIPAGDCDCEGNELDALGVCGGTCSSDEDGDGVCDDAEILGCDQWACNYAPMATENDGSCLKSVRVAPMRLRAITIQMPMRMMGRAFSPNPALIVQATAGIWTGMERDDPLTTWWRARLLLNWTRCLAMADCNGSYLVHLEFENETDVLSAIFSDTLIYDWAELFKSMRLKAVGIRFLDQHGAEFGKQQSLWQIEPLNQYDILDHIGMLSGNASGQLPSWISSPWMNGESICDVDIGDGAVYARHALPTPLQVEHRRVTIARVTTSVLLPFLGMPKSFWREAIRMNFCSRFTRTLSQSNRDAPTLRHAITTNLVTSIGADAFTPTALQHATARVPMDWMEMATGFATMWTIASELKTNVVCVMASGLPTNVDAMIWARMNAIALARSSRCIGCMWW